MNSKMGVLRPIGVNRIRTQSAVWQVELTPALYRHAVLRYCAAGKMRFTPVPDEGRCTIISAGELMFRPCGCVDRAECLDPQGELFMLVLEQTEGEALVEELLPRNSSVVMGQDHGQLRDRFLSLQQELAAKDAASRAMASALATELLVSFVRLLQPQTNLDRLHNQMNAEIVEAAKKVLAQRSHAQVSLSAVAREVHVSTNHLLRLFAKYEGCTPMSYLRGIRLELAARRLRECDSPIKCLAAEVGYGSTEALDRAFRSQYRISPRAYRQQWQDSRLQP